MRVLVASSSYYRQTSYRQLLEGLGHEPALVGGGIECIDRLRRQPPELFILEVPLLWGGSDGVLAVWEEEAQNRKLPIIVICINQGNHDWFQLSNFRVDDFLVRFPTRDELRAAIERCVAVLPRPHYYPRNHDSFSRVALPLSSTILSPGVATCATSPSAKY